MKYGLSFVHFFWTIVIIAALIGGLWAVAKYKPEWLHKACPKLASWVLPSETNPNQTEKKGLKGWADKAKSAVGLGSANRQSLAAAQGVASGMAAVQGIA